VSNQSQGLTISGKNHEKTKIEFSDGSPGRIRTSDQPVNRGLRRGNISQQTGSSDARKGHLSLLYVVQCISSRIIGQRPIPPNSVALVLPYDAR